MVGLVYNNASNNTMQLENSFIENVKHILVAKKISANKTNILIPYIFL